LNANKIAHIRRSRADGLLPVDVARKLGVGRTSAYEYLDGTGLAAEQLTPEP
jgi:hypothetical protein